VKAFRVEFTRAAESDLLRLGNPTAKQVLKKIKWLSENMDLVAPIPLSHDLRGKMKLRVGDWRVIYQIDSKVRLVEILMIGNRNKIYDKY